MQGVSKFPDFRGVFSLIPWRFGEIARIGCIFLLFAAIFSGRFSFDRFFDEVSRTEWLELRVWFTVLAFIGWLVVRRKLGAAHKLYNSVIAWVAVLAYLYIYLIGNLLWIGDNATAPAFVFDALILGVQMFLAFQLIYSLSGLVWLARAAMLVGLVLFAFCLIGFGNPDLNGAGWAPFGGPITFYRIEFLAFCSAFFLYTVSASRRACINLLWAGLCLFAALASLSKVAFLGSVTVIALLLFWLLSIGRWRWALSLGMVAGLTFFYFFYVLGPTLGARVAQAGYTIVPARELLSETGACNDLGARQDREPNWFIYCFKESLSGKIVSPEELSLARQNQIHALLVAAGYSGEIKSLSNALEFASRILLIYDGSGRILMGAHAWQMFRYNPWFGAGIGNYRLGGINQYTKEVEINRYPHNIVLEIAATAGIVGLGFFSVLVFTALVLLQRRVLAESTLIFFMAYPVFVLVTALYSGDYFDFRVFWLTTIAVLAASSPQVPVSQSAARCPPC